MSAELQCQKMRPLTATSTISPDSAPLPMIRVACLPRGSIHRKCPKSSVHIETSVRMCPLEILEILSTYLKFRCLERKRKLYHGNVNSNVFGSPRFMMQRKLYRMQIAYTSGRNTRNVRSPSKAKNETRITKNGEWSTRSCILQCKKRHRKNRKHKVCAALPNILGTVHTAMQTTLMMS